MGQKLYFEFKDETKYYSQYSINNSWHTHVKIESMLKPLYNSRQEMSGYSFTNGSIPWMQQLKKKTEKWALKPS